MLESIIGKRVESVEYKPDSNLMIVFDDGIRLTVYTKSIFSEPSGIIDWEVSDHDGKDIEFSNETSFIKLF